MGTYRRSASPDYSASEEPSTVVPDEQVEGSNVNLDETVNLDDTVHLDEMDSETVPTSKSTTVCDINESTDSVELFISSEPIIPGAHKSPHVVLEPLVIIRTEGQTLSDVETEKEDNSDDVQPVVPDAPPHVITGSAAPTAGDSNPTPSSGEPANADSTALGTPSGNPKRYPAKVGRPSARQRAFRQAAQKIINYEKRSYRRDGVDQECARLHVTYKKWDGTDEPKDFPHASHLPFGTDPLISKDQQQNDYCILCPRQRELDEYWDVQRHYNSVHALKHLVVQDTVILACKCSDVRSRGWATDKSTRNRHYHCIICHHPCDNPQQIANHMHKRHEQVSRRDVAHLLKEKRPAFEEAE